MKDLREVINFDRIKKELRMLSPDYVWESEHIYKEEYFIFPVMSLISGGYGLKNQIEIFYRMFLDEELNIEGDEDFVGEEVLAKFFSDKYKVEKEIKRIMDKDYSGFEHWTYDINFNEADGDLDLFACIPFNIYWEVYGE